MLASVTNNITETNEKLKEDILKGLNKNEQKISKIANDVGKIEGLENLPLAYSPYIHVHTVFQEPEYPPHVHVQTVCHGPDYYNSCNVM